MVWKVSRNLPKAEVKEFRFFLEAMKEAKVMCNHGALEVVITNDFETYVLRRLLD